MITDEHLTLSLPILPYHKEQRWRTFQDEWSAVISDFANHVWLSEKNRSMHDLKKLHSIHELTNFCNIYFEKIFRKVGVSEFFRTKEQEINDIAVTISNNIRTELSNELISQTEKRIMMFDEKINTHTETIDKLYIQKSQIESKYAEECAKTYIVAPLIGRKEVFQRLTKLMEQLYIKKTELESFRFAKKLIPQVVSGLRLLENGVAELLT